MKPTKTVTTNTEQSAPEMTPRIGISDSVAATVAIPKPADKTIEAKAIIKNITVMLINYSFYRDDDRI